MSRAERCSSLHGEFSVGQAGKGTAATVTPRRARGVAVAYLLFSADLRCAACRATPRLLQLRHGSAENADVQVLPGKEFPHARMRIYTTLATRGIFLCFIWL